MAWGLNIIDQDCVPVGQLVVVCYFSPFQGGNRLYTSESDVCRHIKTVPALNELKQIIMADDLKLKKTL